MKRRKKCKGHGGVLCECEQVIYRCPCVGGVPIQQIACIHWQTPADLLQSLKDAAVGGLEEHPTRMLYACLRIGNAQNRKPDAVMQEIIAHKAIKTGNRRLPGEAIRADSIR